MRIKMVDCYKTVRYIESEGGFAVAQYNDLWWYFSKGAVFSYSAGDYRFKTREGAIKLVEDIIWNEHVHSIYDVDAKIKELGIELV